MNAKDLEAFKRILLELRRRLSQNIDQLHNDALKTAGETVDELSDVPSEHMAERGSDNFARDLKIGILQDSDAALCDVNLALDKIEDGTFGVCENCCEPIGQRRLQALPFARLCIKCKQEDESLRANL